jgi:hypothetical protein
MRTKTLAAAAILAAGLASSMAQSNVYSLNVVGYVNKTLLGAGRYTAVANPLNTTNNTLGSLLGGIPAGSSVQKWNPSIADFDVYNKTGFGVGWSPASGATASLNPGEGVFVLTPGASGDITNTFVGEVLQGNLTISLVTGFNMIGNKVPDSGAANTIGLVPPTGSSLQKWNEAVQDFEVFNKTSFGIGWSPSVPNINVAEGFFINAVSPYDWVRNFTVPPAP